MINNIIKRCPYKLVVYLIYKFMSTTTAAPKG